ncbi:MAG: 50S ribosomal protein L22 [Armatimonadetes bacterium]|nr:50S ribosomal protein L22 [Armatimonadota bacterium]
MKEVTAVAKYVRMTPRKLRLVVDLIRGREVSEAENILRFTPKRAAKVLHKVLKSAVANAENNFKMDPGSLFVSKACIDQGPTMKRFMPRAMGRASMIRKRSSHITVGVAVKKGAK